MKEEWCRNRVWDNGDMRTCGNPVEALEMCHGCLQYDEPNELFAVEMWRKIGGWAFWKAFTSKTDAQSEKRHYQGAERMRVRRFKPQGGDL
jgi:hypothetical protein